MESEPEARGGHGREGNGRSADDQHEDNAHRHEADKGFGQRPRAHGVGLVHLGAGGGRPQAVLPLPLWVHELNG